MSNLRITPITTKKKKQDELRITPILTEEEKRQQAMSQSKVMAPKRSNDQFITNMTQNNINNQITTNISNKIVTGGYENEIHNKNMSQATKTSISNPIVFGSKKENNSTPVDTSDFIYNDTGKKYGDYYYDNYELYKDMPIYEQHGKYYLKTNKGYEELGRLDKNGNVAQNVMTTKEAEKEELEKAKKLGFKDNNLKITSQDYDDAQDTFKELQKQYKLSDKELNNWIKTGELDVSHISIQTNKMNSLKQKAEDYRTKINSGKIKQYEQKFDTTNQIYMDTHDMSDDEKQHYISTVTGKKDPTLKNENTFFKGSSVFDDGYQFGDVSKATLGTVGNAGYSFLKGTSKFVEGTSDFAENLIGSGLESVASDKDKKDVKTFHNNTMYTGYKYGNKDYWYDEKSNKLYDKDWNRVYDFDINQFQKKYTYSNKVAEFGRQMKEQTVPDESTEFFDETLHGNDLRKASVLGNKSESILESMGQAVPLMGAGGSVEGLLGSKAAVATTSGLTFANTYGNAKTEAIRNGATEDEAIKSAFIQASAETISEQFFDSIPGAKSAGWGEKLVGKVGNSVEKYMGSKTSKIVMKTLDISGEGFEEIISNMLTAGGNDIVHFIDKDFNYGMENQSGNILDDMTKAMTSQDSMDSFISALLTSAILNAGSSKINSSKRNQVINEIVRTYAEENNISFKEAKLRLRVDGDNVEFNKSVNTSNLPNNLSVEQRNINNNINNQINENVQNSMATMQNNNKVNPPISTTFLNSAKENNYNSNSEIIRNANSIMLKRGIEGRFDSKFFTNNSENALWRKDENGKRSVIFNPNADENAIFQNVVIHEMVHDVLSSKNSADVLNVEDILDFVSKTPGYESARMNLEETYSKVYDRNSDQFKEMVDEEVIATVLGNKLGSQEYINRLNGQKPNLARRIYNWIVNKLDSLSKALGRQSEKAYWRDVANRFEKAFNGEYNSDLNDNTKYMMTSVKGMNNGINTDNKNFNTYQKYKNGIEELDNSSFSNDLSYQGTNHSGVKAYGKKITVDNMYKQIDNLAENNKKNGEALNVINSVKNNPNAKITIYRATPGNNINVGDWVFLTETEADRFSRAIITKQRKIGYKVLKMEVKAKDVDWTGKNLEFVFNPQEQNNYEAIDITNDDIRYSQKSSTWQEHLDKNSNSVEVNAKDNQGRVLSKEQQEYFKESKIRDKEGNLLTMYHGTPDEWNVFDYGLMGRNTISGLARGIFLISDIEQASKYGKNGLKEMYVDIKKPLLKNSKSINVEEYKNFISNFANKYNIDALKVVDIDELYNSRNNDYLVFYETYKRVPFKELENFYKELRNTLGYDGYIIENEVVNSDGVNMKGYTIAVPFNANQIKNVDNLNPTENNDIRYSQKSQTWDEFVENNFKSSGTRTKFSEIKAPINPNAITNQNKVKPPIAQKYQKNTIDEKIDKNGDVPDVLEVKTKPIAPIVENKINRQIEKSSKDSIVNATKVAKKGLDLSSKEKQSFKEKLKKYENKTYDEVVNGKTYNEIRDIIKEYSARPIENIDEEMKSVKSEIKNRSIKIDDNLKAQITDYNDFRKSMFGKLKLSNEGTSIDSLYNELSNAYPYYFDSNVNTEVDMLYELADFMNKDVVDIQRYNLSEREIDNCTSKVFNELKNGLITDDKIQEIKDKINNKKYRLTRKEVREQLLSEMNLTPEELSIGDDIKAFNFQITDPIRVNEKIFGRELGKKVNEATIERTKHNEAERTRWLNSERDDIRELGIKPRSKESAAVQKYGEKKYVNKFGETVEYGDKQLIAEFQNVKTQEKIKRAAEMLRNKYDKYIDQINETITALGYDEIPKRPDYMRHFQELGDIFSQTGVPFNLNDMAAEDLPTDINGLTEFNRPGKNWFASAQKRYGIKTTYDAITGIDGYLEGASNLIFHTEDIQRYRALSGLLRDTFGKTKGFENLENLSNEEALKRIDDIQHNKLSKYVAWLDEQANSLAGKKGAIDRGTERMLGRRGYTILNTIKKQVGSNMVGFNVRSAMTNFISSTIAASKTNKIAMIRGTISTIRNMFHNDGFINKSDFLTSRFGSDSLSPKLWDKISNAGQILMTGSDYFTSNQIVRSKYYEGLQKGMNDTEAIKYADDFGARVMGDRSKGATAEAFNSKTLGFLTQFQLETNNQWQFMVHDTKMDYQKNSKVNGGLKAGATVLFQLGQLCAYSYFFNEIFEKLTGSRAALDPIDILLKLLGWGDDDEDKTFEERTKEAGKELAESIPFAGLFGKGGRMPISDALTPFETAYDYITGKKNSYGGNIKFGDVKNDFLSTLPYFLLPTGYSQIKKTTKGLSMFSDDKEIKGSYTKSGNLRFPVKDTIGNRIQAGLFGEYASEEARKYFNQGRKPLKKNQENMYETLNIPISDYWVITKDLSALKEKLKGKEKEVRQEKIYEYIDSLDISKVRKDILKKSQYKSYTDADTEILYYIYNSKMSKESKKEILKQLGLDK